MSTKTERNVLILAEAATGRTYQDIAAEHGISRQRVDQIVNARQHRARIALSDAVATGKLERPLVCGRCGSPGNIEAHHADYDKLLDVEWLCRPCHTAQHKHAARRVPAKHLPIEWKCQGCGIIKMLKPGLAESVDFCTMRCAGLHRRFDREERFAAEAARLRGYAIRRGYTPGTTEYAMVATGFGKTSAIAVLAQRLDPKQVVCGSYANVMDRLYKTAGFLRPTYGRAPLTFTTARNTSA